MIVLQLVGFFGLALVVLFALGGSIAYLLPRAWRSYTAVLAPLAGYVFLLLVGYYAVRTVLNLSAALLLALGLALVLAVLIQFLRWRKRRGQGEPTGGISAAARSMADRLEMLGFREHWPALLLCLAAIFLAVLPLLSYGYSVPIGGNWDPENYLPITAYLQQVPVGQMGEMPPNPLRDLNAFPPRIGMTLGFCILQGMLSLMPVGGDALATFAPTIALLYGLAALAWYALFRVGFGLGRWAGTIAAGLAGLSSLALWIAFFNFGMQMAALPLVPLALMLWLLVLRYPSWRTVLAAGLVVAALPVAYYPALTVFVPVALGLGLYEVMRRGAVRDASVGPSRVAPPPGPRLERKLRVMPAIAGFATAALSVVLAIGPILDYGQGFSFRYGQQMTTLGLFHFPAFAQLLGLAPFSRTPEALPAAWTILATVALVLAALAAGAVLLFRRSRWIWLSTLIPALLYLAWLRGWFLPLAEALSLPANLVERFRPYPYAYLKGAVFVTPFFWGAAVAGGERLLGLLAKRPGARIWRIMLVGLVLLPLVLTLAADTRLVTRYWGRPAHFDAAALQVREAVELIPVGEEVYLTGRPERSRVLLGLFSYFLLEYPVQGRLSTGYAGYDRRRPGAEPAYALLDADDNPIPLGFFPSDALWTGGGMVLYRRNPEFVAFHDLRTDAYTRRESAEVHAQEPLAERLLNGFGSYQQLSGGETFRLYANNEWIPPQGTSTPDAGARVFSFATFDPATVTLRWADGTSETCILPAGFSLCRSRTHQMPSWVEMTPETGATVWPCWAALVEGGGEAGVVPRPETFFLLPYASVTGGGALQVVLHWHSDNSRPLRLALEVWENTYSGAHHYAWWGPAQLPEQGVLYLRADLAARRAQLEMAGPLHLLPIDFVPHPGADDWPEAADGSYFAALWVYYGGQVVEVLPVGRFTVVGGQVQGLEAIDLGPRLLWPHSPPEVSGARFGESFSLAAYELAGRTFSPGDSVPLALEWHALEPGGMDYAVSVQLLKDGRLEGQWDGPLGQWYTTGAWRPGQFIRDDIPLRVPAEALSGRYQLIVVVYDPATGHAPARARGGRTGSGGFPGPRGYYHPIVVRIRVQDAG